MSPEDGATSFQFSFAGKMGGRRAPRGAIAVAYQMDFNCQDRWRSRRVV